MRVTVSAIGARRDEVVGAKRNLLAKRLRLCGLSPALLTRSKTTKFMLVYIIKHLCISVSEMLDPPTTFEPYGKEFTLTPAVLQVIYIDFRNIQSLGISTVERLLNEDLLHS